MGVSVRILRVFSSLSVVQAFLIFCFRFFPGVYNATVVFREYFKCVYSTKKNIILRSSHLF